VPKKRELGLSGHCTAKANPYTKEFIWQVEKLISSRKRANGISMSAIA
jgi:hypothetical protein